MSEDYRDRASKRKAQLGQSIWFKLETGNTTFRIAPTPAGKTSPPVFYERGIHRDVGPKKLSLTCGKAVNDEGVLEGDCYIDDSYRVKLEKQGREARAAALEPQIQMVLQVFRINEDTDKWEGPFIWTPSPGLGGKLMGLLSSKKRLYADAKKGYNITINRKGTTKNDTRYGEMEPDTDPTPVPAEMLKKLKPFDQLKKELQAYSLAAQKAAILGTEVIDEDVDDDIDEDEEEVAPKSKASGKAKPAAKKKPVGDDEDEDADDEEADDVDVDEADEDEADDVDEDVDEDDEDEPVVKSKKAAPAKKAVGKKKAAPIDEDEEDDVDVDEDEGAEPDDEDDDDEPVKPSKKATPVTKGKATKKAVPEPDEDEEEDDIDLEDEDEEDEPEVVLPKKKSAVVKKAVTKKR